MVRQRGPPPGPPPILHHLRGLEERGPSGPRGKFHPPTFSSGYGHGGGPSGLGDLGSRRTSPGFFGRAIPPCGGDESSDRRGHGPSLPLGAGGSWVRAGVGFVSAYGGRRGGASPPATWVRSDGSGDRAPTTRVGLRSRRRIPP